MEPFKGDEILKVGISLEPIGINNWALTKTQALTALNQFLALEIPILGGDVCEDKDGTIQYNYDNWFCDRLAGETKSVYAERSIKKARTYIESYHKSIDKIFFVLVPEV